MGGWLLKVNSKEREETAYVYWNFLFQHFRGRNACAIYIYIYIHIHTYIHTYIHISVRMTHVRTEADPGTTGNEV